MLLPRYSDVTMAEAFVEKYRHQLRYVPYHGWWERDMETFGWAEVETAAVLERAFEMARVAVEEVREAGAVEHYRAAESRLASNAVSNVMRLAARTHPIRTTLDEVEPEAMMSIEKHPKEG